MSQRRLLWDPLGSNKFILSGHSELRLYSWQDPVPGQDPQFTLLGASTELGQLRAFDWSVSSSRLLACGLTTGRATLLQLEPDQEHHTVPHSINGTLGRVSATELLQLIVT